VKLYTGFKVVVANIDEILAYVKHLWTEIKGIKGLLGIHKKQMTEIGQEVKVVRVEFPQLKRTFDEDIIAVNAIGEETYI
jgi:hypothetical protein